ncbi:MAG: efflux RND transporter periplasmic adaptor subunit [Nevskia sp.]|nr:efflux RND transporter periplasmic adaptor subunit [Nevskia sp.]
MKPSVCPLLAILIAALTSACSASDEAANAAAPVPASASVTTVAPQRRSFAVEVEAYGRLVGDPRRALSLSLPQAGRVGALAVAPGQRVAAGQTLLELETDPVARLAYAQAQHALAQARAEFDQTQALYDRHLATEAQLAAARKALDDAQANLAAQRALDGGQGITRLAAPVAGVVESVEVRSGQRIASGSALLRLVPDADRYAELGVEPALAATIPLGARASVQPVFGGAALEGRVAQVSAAVDAQTRLVALWIVLPDAARWPLGSALTARIETSTRAAWAVPRAAVLADERGAYLFQVEDGVAHRVDVQLVAPAGDPVGVDGALDPKNPVVALGAYELADGMRVRVQAP